MITKANRQVFSDYGVNITECITISGLSVRIFLKDFYKRNIPCITQASLYEDIKQAYYGGITEVYKPCGHNLFYYDVNSLYPYVALQDMPGLECSKVNYYTNKSIDDLFGFFYCSIESPLDSYLGLLPVRDEPGIYFPVGKWTGWYFSEISNVCMSHFLLVYTYQKSDNDKYYNLINVSITMANKLLNRYFNCTRDVYMKENDTSISYSL